MIFCNGIFIRDHQPIIEVSDRGFLFGDAVFTTIKVVDGEPQFLREHLERLKKQCAHLHIIPPELKLSAIDELIERNDASKGIFKLKIIITGGNTPHLSLSNRLFGKHIMMITPVLELLPSEYRLNIFPIPLSSCFAKLKTLSYLDRLFVHDYALKEGFDDALVLSLDGFIQETSFSNIFWSVQNEIFVPDFKLDLLVGVMLSHQIEVFKMLGKKIHFVCQRPEDIPSESRVFVCNSLKGVLPVVSIGKREFTK